MKWVSGNDKLPGHGNWLNAKINDTAICVYWHANNGCFIDRGGNKRRAKDVLWLDESEKTFEFENEFWWREVFEQYIDKYSSLDSWSGDYNECLELVKKNFKITNK